MKKRKIINLFSFSNLFIGLIKKRNTVGLKKKKTTKNEFPTSFESFEDDFYPSHCDQFQGSLPGT